MGPAPINQPRMPVIIRPWCSPAPHRRAHVHTRRFIPGRATVPASYDNRGWNRAADDLTTGRNRGWPNFLFV